jgi:hypothetical protein
MQQASDTVLLLGASLTGTAYTPSRTDAGRVLEASNGSAVTITLPLVSVAGWLVGTVIQVFQQGAGQVTIAGAGGVTLRSNGGKLKTAAQYAMITLRMRANDEWVVYGDTVA